jgi:hypothetical protein
MNIVNAKAPVSIQVRSTAALWHNHVPAPHKARWRHGTRVELAQVAQVAGIGVILFNPRHQQLHELRTVFFAWSEAYRHPFFVQICHGPPQSIGVFGSQPNLTFGFQVQE